MRANREEEEEEEVEGKQFQGQQTQYLLVHLPRRQVVLPKVSTGLKDVEVLRPDELCHDEPPALHQAKLEPSLC